MKDYYYYLLGTATTGLTFIESLIPIIQLILLIISLILTLIGIAKSIKEKLDKKESILPEIIDAKNSIEEASSKIENITNKINENKKGDE